MILAPVTRRCPSNVRSASSTSGLLAPAAQTSAGRAACSCLPWLAVMPRRPHRPLLLPPLARASLYSPTPPVILRRRQPHTAAEPVNPRTPLRVGIHCRIFPSSTSSPSKASPSSTALVLSARRGQRGQGTTSIGRVLYVERLTAGCTAAARKCLLITRKIIIPPPDSGDPPDGPPYFTKKSFPLTAGTHQLHLRMQGSASGQKKRFAH